jgi:aminoglycoside phosphotransferase (APT) family kinase protein
VTRLAVPAAEVDIDETLVRRLLGDQCPDLAALPLVAVPGGWDNAIFRLGTDRAVRLPRRAPAAPLVEREQRWLPVLAPRLPLGVPVPERIGRPGHGYPWSWSVTPWFDGEPASRTGPLDTEQAADALAGFLVALHQQAPVDAPRSTFRGLPLAERTERVDLCVRACAPLLDVTLVLQCWHALAATPAWPGPPLWLHGDLHPGNVVMQGSELAAVLDFGDVCAGDPATDLAAAWLLLTAGVRPQFRRTVERAGLVDPHVWRRAQGWALALSVIWLAHARDDAQVTRECLWTVSEVLAA